MVNWYNSKLPGEVEINSSFKILLTFAIALKTPFPKYFPGSLSRNSTASYFPVEAPDGTAALPIIPHTSERADNGA